MNKLVYRFSDTLSPRCWIEKQDVINYLYKDNYVHVRLDTFGKEKELIVGFERKLAFYLTYLMQKEVQSILDLPSIKEARDKKNYQEIWKKCLACLKNSTTYKLLDEYFDEYLGQFGYKGIKILPVYSLKNKPKDAFDLLGEVKDAPSLSGISFCDLFRDSFEISVEEERIVDHSKFARKHKEKSINTYQLW